MEGYNRGISADIFQEMAAWVEPSIREGHWQLLFRDPRNLVWGRQHLPWRALRHLRVGSVGELVMSLNMGQRAAFGFFDLEVK